MAIAGIVPPNRALVCNAALPLTAGHPRQEQTASAETSRAGLSPPASSVIQRFPDLATEAGTGLVTPQNLTLVGCIRALSVKELYGRKL